MKTKPLQTMREFFSRPDVQAQQDIQKRNPWNSQSHLDATREILRLATEIGAEKYFTNIESFKEIIK